MIDTEEILNEEGEQYMKRVIESTFYKGGERDEMDCKHYSKGLLIRHYIIKHYEDGTQPTVKNVVDKTKGFEFPEIDTEKKQVIAYLIYKDYIGKNDDLSVLQKKEDWR